MPLRVTTRRVTSYPSHLMVGFIIKPIGGPVFLGVQLAAARAALGLSLEACARSTGIGEQHLRSLEAGNFDALPGDVYIRCFLRAYAALLQLPAPAVLAAYRREVKLARRRPAAGDPRLPIGVASRWHFVVTPKWVRAGVGVAAVFLLLGYLGVKVEAIVRPPELVVESPADVLLTDTHVYELAGRTEPGTLLSVNGAPVPVDPDGAFRQSLTLPDGVSTIRLVARKGHSREQVVQRRVIVRASADGFAPNP